jgi:hypothetical protein
MRYKSQMVGIMFLSLQRIGSAVSDWASLRLGRHCNCGGEKAQGRGESSRWSLDG